VTIAPVIADIFPLHVNKKPAFLQPRLGAAPLFFQSRGPAHGLPLGLGAASAFGCPRADQVALNIGEASEYGGHQAPGAGAVGPRFPVTGVALWRPRCA
jgi:hypothetical protein